MDTLHFDGFATSREWKRAARGIAVGAHLISEREGYTHHGIYAGDGRVIHYGGFHRLGKRRPVEYIALHRFAGQRGVTVCLESNAAYTGQAALERAKSRLGEDRYRLLTNNCEHFCTWCVSGVERSDQVRRCLTRPWIGLHTLVSIVRGMCMVLDAT